MPAKIQRQLIRYLPEKAGQKQSSAKSLGIQEAVTILGGITGLIVAILWLGGRSYMEGYFTAMNIPSFQINFSIWEYAEASWQRLIFYFLSKIYTPLVLVASIFLIILLSTFVLQRVFPNLKMVEAVKKIRLPRKNLRSSIKSASVFSVALYFLYLLLVAFIDINKTGQIIGRDTVLTKSHAIEIYSKESLPLGTGEVVPNTSPSLIHYSGLRLLINNNGKYYLFRDVDPVTCKPSQVFIINDSPGTYFVLGDTSRIDAPCYVVSPTVLPNTTQRPASTP